MIPVQASALSRRSFSEAGGVNGGIKNWACPNFPCLSVPLPVTFRYFKNTTQGMVGDFSSMLNLFVLFFMSFLRFLFLSCGAHSTIIAEEPKIVPHI